MVTVAIFVTLSMMIIINFRQNSPEKVLSNTVLDFSQSLRQAQNYALTCSNVSGLSYFGYGVFILNYSRYLIFADVNKNYIYDEGIDVVMEEKNFLAKVKNSRTGSSTFFQCPSAKVCFNADCTGTNDLIYDFKHTAGGTRSVILDLATGRIQTE